MVLYITCKQIIQDVRLVVYILLLSVHKVVSLPLLPGISPCMITERWYKIAALEKSLHAFILTD